MTTTIRVSAHCNRDTTKVRVIKSTRDDDANKSLERREEVYLEDGDTLEFTVYDDQYVSVDEIPK